MTLFDVNYLFTLNVGNQLGEGVIWDDKLQRILWTDIEASKLYLYQLETETTEVIQLPQRLGSFGLTEQENLLICAFETGFALFDLVQHKIEWLAQIEADNPGTRMNDGRVDRQGVFWAGTMVEEEATATARSALYSIDANRKVTKHLSNLQISNGLCWSPDGKTMYFADSPTHKIVSFDNTQTIDEQSIARNLVSTAVEHFPDGSTTDKHGNIWNALWGSNKVVCYSPDGEVIVQLTLPVSQPSCVSIGGPDLNWLIITSASQLTEQQKEQEPQAGHLFVYQLNHSIGLPEPRFKLTTA